MDELVRALGRWWARAGVIALAVLVCAVAATLVVPRTYTASAIVAVVPRPDTSPSGELVRIAVPTYGSLTTSQAVSDSVAERFGEDRGRLDSAISSDVPPSTNLIVVSVRWSDPTRAAELANGVVDELLAFSDSDPLLSSLVVAPALPPNGPSFPPARAAFVLSALLALAAGVATALVSERRHPKVSAP